MSNVVFYFTGTGNSLAVARNIADKMGNTSVVSIAEAINENKLDLPYERIGFVFPVYFFSIPAIVKRFVKKLNFLETQYVFGISTYGGLPGKALMQLERFITERGGSLNAGFSIKMPGNYIVNYGAFSESKQKQLFEAKNNKVNDISLALKEKKAVPVSKTDFTFGLLDGLFKRILEGFGKQARNFRVNGNCTGCATCRSICPVGNIRMENKQPTWSDKCEMCMACIQWCPVQAIDYADKTTARKRYRNPEVELSDLIANAAQKTV